jgi:hypothetical protein
VSAPVNLERGRCGPHAAPLGALGVELPARPAPGAPRGGVVTLPVSAPALRTSGGLIGHLLHSPRPPATAAAGLRLSPATDPPADADWLRIAGTSSSRRWSP